MGDNSSNFRGGVGDDNSNSMPDIVHRGPHRTTCHGCGNVRRHQLQCLRCPTVYCRRCAERMVMEFGVNSFEKGCPVCHWVCCCSNPRVTNVCERIYHCYKRCRSKRLSGKTGASEDGPTTTALRSVHFDPTKRHIVDHVTAEAIVTRYVSDVHPGGVPHLTAAARAAKGAAQASARSTTGKASPRLASKHHQQQLQHQEEEEEYGLYEDGDLVEDEGKDEENDDTSARASGSWKGGSGAASSTSTTSSSAAAASGRRGEHRDTERVRNNARRGRGDMPAPTSATASASHNSSSSAGGGGRERSRPRSGARRRPRGPGGRFNVPPASAGSHPDHDDDVEADHDGGDYRHGDSDDDDDLDGVAVAVRALSRYRETRRQPVSSRGWGSETGSDGGESEADGAGDENGSEADSRHLLLLRHTHTGISRRPTSHEVDSYPTEDPSNGVSSGTLSGGPRRGLADTQHGPTTSQPPATAPQYPSATSFTNGNSGYVPSSSPRGSLASGQVFSPTQQQLVQAQMQREMVYAQAMAMYRQGVYPPHPSIYFDPNLNPSMGSNPSNGSGPGAPAPPPQGTPYPPQAYSSYPWASPSSGEQAMRYPYGYSQYPGLPPPPMWGPQQAYGAYLASVAAAQASSGGAGLGAATGTHSAGIADTATAVGSGGIALPPTASAPGQESSLARSASGNGSSATLAALSASTSSSAATFSTSTSTPAAAREDVSPSVPLAPRVTMGGSEAPVLDFPPPSAFDSQSPLHVVIAQASGTGSDTNASTTVASASATATAAGGTSTVTSGTGSTAAPTDTHATEAKDAAGNGIPRVPALPHADTANVFHPSGGAGASNGMYFPHSGSQGGGMGMQPYDPRMWGLPGGTSGTGMQPSAAAHTQGGMSLPGVPPMGGYPFSYPPHPMAMGVGAYPGSYPVYPPGMMVGAMGNPYHDYYGRGQSGPESDLEARTRMYHAMASGGGMPPQPSPKSSSGGNGMAAPLAGEKRGRSEYLNGGVDGGQPNAKRSLTDAASAGVGASSASTTSVSGGEGTPEGAVAQRYNGRGDGTLNGQADAASSAIPFLYPQPHASPHMGSWPMHPYQMYATPPSSTYPTPVSSRVNGDQQLLPPQPHPSQQQQTQGQKPAVSPPGLQVDATHAPAPDELLHQVAKLTQHLPATHVPQLQQVVSDITAALARPSADSTPDHASILASLRGVDATDGQATGSGGASADTSKHCETRSLRGLDTLIGALSGTLEASGSTTTAAGGDGETEAVLSQRALYQLLSQLKHTLRADSRFSE